MVSDTRGDTFDAIQCRLRLRCHIYIIIYLSVSGMSLNGNVSSTKNTLRPNYHGNTFVVCLFVLRKHMLIVLYIFL